MATYSSILAWRIPWIEECGRLHTVHGVAKSQTQLSDCNSLNLTLTASQWQSQALNKNLLDPRASIRTTVPSYLHLIHLKQFPSIQISSLCKFTEHFTLPQQPTDCCVDVNLYLYHVCFLFEQETFFLPCSPPTHSPTILFHTFVVPEQLTA